MVTTTQRRSRPRGESRRCEILDAALQVFLESGYNGATIDLVVAKANASKATIYNHFGGKDGLFSTIVKERTEHILSCIFVQDISDMDVPTALSQIARQLLTATMTPDALGIYRLILSEGVRFPELAQTFYRIGPEQITAHLARILVGWRERGLIVVDDPECTASQFLTIVLGEMHLRAVAGLLPADLEAAIDRNVCNAVELFWRGIRREDRL
ncbi:TetR/AcrR family transcriptional regulator [Azospirillum sp. YIM B02556]|uniref:TetR/AcrR family transcriptional regulator n=1 Tax=Azospirillum endophyticum TaxID=2800326 RepID=A0ABS1FGW8_9PROT|nr:TetR/AcrR family transcriptional regulator [Azospirillum endophyticum]MBK1842681.1 TetR/AcrR family transcriptional regulator [Azospirillum endophyticum]